MGAQLVDADLSGADLTKANLSRADLGGCNLNHVALNGTSLQAASLVDARLRNADLTDTLVDAARWDRAQLTNVRIAEHEVLRSWTGNPYGMMKGKSAFRRGEVMGRHPKAKT